MDYYEDASKTETCSSSTPEQAEHQHQHDEPASLEGALHWRRGNGSAVFWRRRYVVLNLIDGGSISCYRFSATDSKKKQQQGTPRVTTTRRRSSTTKLHRRLSLFGAVGDGGNCNDNDAKGTDNDENLALHIPATVPWHVKDVENDPSCFVIEIEQANAPAKVADENSLARTPAKLVGSTSASAATSSPGGRAAAGALQERQNEGELPPVIDDDENSSESGDSSSSCSSNDNNNNNNNNNNSNSLDFAGPDSSDELLFSDVGAEDEDMEVEEEEEDGEEGEDNLYSDIAKARRKGKPLRFYFKCLKGGNEKVLWLKAFARMGRLSTSFRRKRFLLGTFKSKTHVRLTASRRRSAASAAFARESKQLETTTTPINQTKDDHRSSSVTSPSSAAQSVSVKLSFTAASTSKARREKEHKVLPEHAYPNVWMTTTELQEEMEKPSATVHDLRQQNLDFLPNNPCNRPEVGTFQIECLQGLGFPKLNQGHRYGKQTEADAVVYMVCGPYAFCTDVIKNRANPMWLPKTQRACTFPLHHAYARVFIGVFGDEKKTRTKDDFNGRVVLDVSRLRPNCTYDVTLPLRLSAHVYSRRKRGAIRLRFRVQWGSVRSALLSYLPTKISRPRNFKPNTDTVVPCGSSRAFRNVAITVHGSHLPGRFSFQQLRAALREVNFTRKSVMGVFRNTLKELREWENPLMSAFVFCGWMHCVYQNAFSLVPAYVVSYFMLHLIRNYARYGMDGPSHRGFIPPSWEEMLMSLLKSDSKAPSIEPLNMGYYQSQIGDGDHSSQILQYNTETHEPKGKTMFRALGFLDEQDQNINMEDNPMDLHHHEFAFADGKVYPKFGVRESLVDLKAKKRRTQEDIPGRASQVSPQNQGLQERLLCMDMPNIVRRDCSRTNDYDDEEERFGTAKFIRQTGAASLKGAASGLMDVGESLTEVTGLQHFVMSPINNYVVPPMKSGIRTGISGINHVVSPPLHYVVPPIKSGIITGINGINHVVTAPLHTVGSIRRMSNECVLGAPDAVIETIPEGDDDDLSEAAAFGDSFEASFDADPSSAIMFSEWAEEGDQYPLTPATPTAQAPAPDQDIDYTGSSAPSNDTTQNRKRLTDDLVEVKEKMHELTLHKFNDRAYIVKDSNSCYFGGQNQRSFKRRKVEVTRNLDKLLQSGRYSHSNPVVSRVGQYVEPIVGASYSFLCAFRALFNVMTWKDPFLTFWVSLFGFVLVIILFVFPWRLFLFVLGLWFVGPHNWVIRILRKRGILPPKRPRSRLESTPEDIEVPSDQTVFKGHISSDQKRKPHKQVDPREVQYVVVPYSPLMYQRFYDWPPEPEYAQVCSDGGTGQPSPMFASNQTSFDSYGGVSSETEDNSFFASTIASATEKKNQ